MCLLVLLLQFEDDEPPEKEVQETPKQRKERLRLESLQRNKERVEEEIRNCKKSVEKVFTRTL